MHITSSPPATGDSSATLTAPPLPAVNASKARLTLHRTATSHPSCSSTRKHRRRPSSSDSYFEMVTPDQYDVLPVSLQKKYFSSVERLHLVQRSAADKRKKRCRKQTWLSGPSSSDLPLRPVTATVLDQPSALSSSTQLSRPKSAHILSAEGAISHDQALWFLSLPDKVRRQHFSREEQATLFARCQATLYPDQNSLQHHLPTPPVEDHIPTPPVCARNDSESNVNPEMRFLKLYTRKRAEVTDAPAPPTAPSALPAASHPLPPATSKKPRRKSFHRISSLTPLALPPPTLAPIPSLPSPDVAINFALSARLSRPYFDTMELPAESLTGQDCMEVFELPGDMPLPCPALDTERVSNSESLETLRQSLPSDGNVEEAESLDLPMEEPTSPSLSSTATESYPVQRPESLDSGEGDDDASFETHGPRTPTASPDEEHHIGIAHSMSIGSSMGLPVQINCEDLIGRTSRSSSGMSNHKFSKSAPLTRPRLRGSEDRLYSWEERLQSSSVDMARHDLLALEALAVCDDPTGAHGAFAAPSHLQAKGLKRVWKSIRGQ